MRRSVLITGASSGIGREIVRVLASSYDVIIHYNNNYESALELKKEIDNLNNLKKSYDIAKLNNENLNSQKEELESEIKQLNNKISNLNKKIDKLK